MPSHNWEGWKNSDTVCKLLYTVVKMVCKFWSENNSFSIIWKPLNNQELYVQAEIVLFMHFFHPIHISSMTGMNVWKIMLCASGVTGADYNITETELIILI